MRRTATAWLPKVLLAWVLCCGPAAMAGDVIKVGGTGTLLGTLRVLAAAYQEARPDARIEVVANLGSSGGVRALLGGAIDLGLVSRPLKPAEVKAGIVEHRLGRTPYVFAVARDRPEQALTQTLLVEILRGARTQWEDGTPIRLSLRPTDDSDNEAIDGISAAVAQARRAAHARPGMLVAASDQENADFIESVRGGFGGVALALILSEGRRLRPLAFDGAAPTAAALASGAYRLQKTLSLVVRGEPTPAVRRFLDFIDAPRGKAVLRSLGIVPAVH